MIVKAESILVRTSELNGWIENLNCKHRSLSQRRDSMLLDVFGDTFSHFWNG
jgi:hypothetical protein